MKILSVNVGSTSLKYQLLTGNWLGSASDISFQFSGSVERIGDTTSYFHHTNYVDGKPVSIEGKLSAPSHLEAIEYCVNLMPDFGQIDGIGFKTVFAKDIWQSAIIDQSVVQALEAYIPLAPLHNRAYLAAIRSFQKILSKIPLVAVMETWFHQSIPDYAYEFGIPRYWLEKHQIRRYGFHGASHRWISERVPQVLKRSATNLRIVSCHLGGSSSVTAIKNGQSIDTSMGVSTQCGVVQSTRVGDLDPFAVLYVMEKESWSPAEVTRQLMEESGLKGISSFASDMRDLNSAAENGNDQARLAIETYCYGVKKYIGAYVAALGGIDVLAFTGGIGEKSANTRFLICSGLEYMGIKLDLDKNDQNLSEISISTNHSQVQILTIPANEEFVVARETARLIQGNLGN